MVMVVGVFYVSSILYRAWGLFCIKAVGVAAFGCFFVCLRATMTGMTIVSVSAGPSTAPGTMATESRAPWTPSCASTPRGATESSGAISGGSPRESRAASCRGMINTGTGSVRMVHIMGVDPGPKGLLVVVIVVAV